MDARAHILLIEDDAGARSAIEAWLRAAGLHVHAAGSGEEGLALLEAISPDAVLLDLGLPAMGGRQLLGLLRARLRHAPVVVLTAEREAEVAVECMKAGAWDYLVKPVGEVRLLTTLANALHQHALSRTVATLERAVDGTLPAGLLGQSAPLLALLAGVEQVAEGDRSVLVTGDPGTERGAVALAIHARSRRAAGPFRAVRCGRLDAARQAEELFGGEGGGVAASVGGTLYLEDVEALAPPVQERLEAALELAARARMGVVAAPDFRLVSSTAAELPALVRRKAFRGELYMRLAAAELAIPPLRERGEDVVLLARHDAAARAEARGRRPPAFSAEALAALRAHGWPGNREELRQVVERAVDGAGEDLVHPADLALPAMPGGRSTVPQAVHDSLRLVDLERDAILAALERAAGSRTEASRELGISRATLYRKLKEHGIE